MNKNGFECDYNKISQIYIDSRNNPEVIKNQKKKLLGKGSFEWNKESLEWEEISKVEYEKKRKQRYLDIQELRKPNKI